MSDREQQVQQDEALNQLSQNQQNQNQSSPSDKQSQEERNHSQQSDGEVKKIQQKDEAIHNIDIQKSTDFHIPQANDIKDQHQLIQSHDVIQQSATIQPHYTTAQVIVDQSLETIQPKQQLTDQIELKNQVNQNINQEPQNKEQEHVPQQYEIQPLKQQVKEENNNEIVQQSKNTINQDHNNHSNQQKNVKQSDQNLNKQYSQQVQSQKTKQPFVGQEVGTNEINDQQNQHENNDIENKKPSRSTINLNEQQKNNQNCPQRETIQVKIQQGQTSLIDENIQGKDTQVLSEQQQPNSPPRQSVQPEQPKAVLSKQIELEPQNLDSHLTPYVTNVQTISKQKQTQESGVRLKNQQTNNNIAPKSQIKTSQKPINNVKRKQKADSADSSTCKCLLF